MAREVPSPVIFHCLRTTGTQRAWFETPEGAAAFRDKYREYAEDIVVLCGRCGFYHCSNPNWPVNRPWEVPVEMLRAN